MLVLLDTPEDLNVCEKELGQSVEQLFTPQTRRAAQRPDQMFAIDNGAFGGFDPGRFRNLLKLHTDRRKLCRWVALPDVVGSARRTLELFRWWRADLHGWRVALVAQDGLEDLDIPWRDFDAVFIGGTTGWKLSTHARDVIKTAKACEKWVHVGRVNMPARYEYFEMLGADSIDGTGLSRYTWMREAIFEAAQNPGLFHREATA